MTIKNVLASVSVVDFDSALAWYERLLGRPADRHPMDGLAEWQLTSHGGLQVVSATSGGGGGQLTIVVDDLQTHVPGLAERGISGAEITRGDVAQFAPVTDPEGNTIIFSELLVTPRCS